MHAPDTQAPPGFAPPMRHTVGVGRRMLLIGAGAAATCLAAPSVWAQGYPTKPVTIIVPFAAGGTVDKVAREVQQVLAAQLGQSVIIENRGGAGGTIGAAAVAKAAPDGYTIGMVFDSYATERYIYPSLRYSAEKDLTGVSYMVRSPMVLAVPTSAPYKTLQDYVQASKAGGISYASVGSGSSNHLATELFHQTAGTRGIHTPYKGGGPAISDLLGGHVNSIIASLPLVLPHIQGGKLRALAVTAPQRVGALPDVPAVAESYPGFEVYSWVGMIAPDKIPAAVLERLSSAVQRALQDPSVVQRMRDAGFEVVAGGPQDMNQLVRTESQRWGRLIKDLGIATH